jgi:esterase/lipase
MLRYLCSRRLWLVFCLLPPVSISATKAEELSPTSIEKAVTCRRSAFFFTEKRVLSWWAEDANEASTKLNNEFKNRLKALEELGYLETFSLTMSDGRVIGGRRLRFSTSPSATAVIVASGNVSTADMLTLTMEAVARAAGYDFYFVDYRGYGLSKNAIGSLSALTSDLIEVGGDLRTKGYQRLYAYGPSFGGFVLLNAANKGLKLDRLIIDSIPSEVDDYDCDAAVHPINTVVSSCPHIVALTSLHDREVPGKRQEKLLQFIQRPACAGTVVVLKDAIHALNDKKGSPGEAERHATIINALKE